MAAREPFRVDKRKLLITSAIALAIGVGAIAGIGELANYHAMQRALQQAGKWWLAVGVLGEVAAYVGYVIAYRDVARVDGGPRLDYWTATRVVMVGFGAFIAGSSAGTLGVDYWALNRAGEKPHVAARRVLALNTLEWGILASLTTAAGALTLVYPNWHAPYEMELAWIVITPTCVAAAIWVSSPVRVGRFTTLPRDRRRLARASRTWLPWLRDLARSGLADAIGGVVLVRHVVARPRRHPGALLGFAVFWAGDIFAMWTTLNAFDAAVPLAPLVLAYTTGYVVTSLPLPLGGAGGVEAGLAFSLHSVGVPLSAALLATLAYRVYTLWIPLLVAVAFLPQVPKLAAELPRVRHAN